MKRKTPGGFTLIELMIVVATIGVLTGIALPAFNKFICRSKAVEARTVLRQYYIAEQAYYGEHDEYQPDLTMLSVEFEGNVSRYDVDILIDNSGETPGFTLVAQGKSGSDMQGDVWHINEQNEINWFEVAPGCE